MEMYVWRFVAELIVSECRSDRRMLTDVDAGPIMRQRVRRISPLVGTRPLAANDAYVVG